MKNYKVLARVTAVETVGEFQLQDGEDLDKKVRETIIAAAREGRLGRMSTRAGLPPISLQEMGDEEGLSGAQETKSIALYSSVGIPLKDRQFRVTDHDGNFLLEGSKDNGDTFEILGMFPEEASATTVGQFWRNGSLD